MRPDLTYKQLLAQTPVHLKLRKPTWASLATEAAARIEHALCAARTDDDVAAATARALLLGERRLPLGPRALRLGNRLSPLLLQLAALADVARDQQYVVRAL